DRDERTRGEHHAPRCHERARERARWQLHAHLGARRGVLRPRDPAPARGAGVSARAAARLAQALAVLCAASVLAAAVLLLLVRRSGFDVEAQPLGVGAALFGFPLVGALAATRRPSNPVGWIM